MIPEPSARPVTAGEPVREAPAPDRLSVARKARLGATVRARLPEGLRFRLEAAVRHRSPEFLHLSRPRADRKLIAERFEARFGRAPDLESPVTFSEKVQWRKLFDRRPLWTTLLDKHRVREWVADRVGEAYLIPLLAVTDAPTTLSFERLSPPWIVKPNHMSGVVFPVRDGREAERLARGNVPAFLRDCLALTYGQALGEWGYRDIAPRVIVERLLLDGAGRMAQDYEIHCFGGRPRYILVDLHRWSTAPKRTSTYDPDWRRLELNLRDRLPGPDLPRPDGLEEMMEVAAALSAGTDYLRVDLYAAGGTVFFGEMTVYPASGFRGFVPEGAEAELGRQWRLPERRSGRGVTPPPGPPPATPPGG